MYVMGFSETPLHFIFRHKGDSVGRYRRYRRDTPLARGCMKGYDEVAK